MMVIWKNMDGKTCIQTGTTRAQITEMRQDGTRLRIIRTGEMEEAAQFLEALNKLATEAGYQVDILLSVIYNLGVEDGQKLAKKGGL